YVFNGNRTSNEDIREWYMNGKVGDTKLIQGSFTTESVINSPFYTYGIRNNATNKNSTIKVNRILIAESDVIISDWTPAPEDMATATQISTLTNTVDGFQSKVDKVESDYQKISGTVATHTSSISSLNGQIALKANTTTVNALTGRVSTAETGISSNAKDIK